MKKTRMPQRLLALVLVLMMLISVLPVSAMAAELTPADAQTGLTATDVTNELTDSDRLSIFEENMDPSKVSKSDVPADDEMVRVIVQLDADSLLDARNRTNAGMSMLDFQQTAAAKAQLEEIADVQLSVMNAMESQSIPSSFTFSYTSVISGFAAQVPYGRINDIKKLDGVVDVVLCQTYYTDSMGSATLGQALTAAEVAAYSNNTQYQGEGTLIGILDTGLDVNHEAFANAPAVQKLQKSGLSKLLYQISQGEDGKTKVTAYSYAALWYAQKHSSSSLELLTEDDLYKSAKVPFAFDYADADADVVPSADAVEKYGNDHGTHVAGIAAGKTVDANGSVTFAGQSPEAQLAIFKVFSDSTNGASTDTILAALNDALLLDVDVINMSLGSNGGFGREAEGDLTTKYYDLVKASGILLNCSVGNSYSSSQGGAHGDFTSVSDPDTGIISSSSSYDAALSVASVNANETAAFLIGEGRVPYNDVSGHSFTQLLLGSETSKTYEYVMVPNNGDVADYQGLDVTGKIAVVMRGGLSFEQKQLNAAAAGAAGCVIYNNRDGYLLNMSVENYKIPTVCISLSNGQMMANETEKKLTVSSTEKGYVAMSDFSSWGPLPSLSLKPEITAPGGNIYSSLPFAQYGYMSGTSMASPYLAGVAAAANEKKERGRSPSQISLPLPGVPDLPLFRVVVGHIFHTGQLYIVHHLPNGRLNVAILAALVFRLKPRVHLHDGAMSGGVAPPAQGNEVHGVVTAALAPGLDVMDLQPVRTVTEGAAPAVALVHAAPHAVWDTGRHAVHVLVLHCLFRPFCPLWAVPLQPRSQGRSRRQAAGRARANRPGHSRDCARPGLYSRVIMKRPKRASSPSCSRGAAIAVCPASATAAPSFRCPGTRRDNGGTC